MSGKEGPLPGLDGDQEVFLIETCNPENFVEVDFFGIKVLVEVDPEDPSTTYLSD